MAVTRMEDGIFFFWKKQKEEEKTRGREKLVTFSLMAFAYTCSQVERGVL